MCVCVFFFVSLPPIKSHPLTLVEVHEIPEINNGEQPPPPHPLIKHKRFPLPVSSELAGLSRNSADFQFSAIQLVRNEVPCKNSHKRCVLEFSLSVHWNR